jgi:hypothetical protein
MFDSKEQHLEYNIAVDPRPKMLVELPSSWQIRKSIRIRILLGVFNCDGQAE